MADEVQAEADAHVANVKEQNVKSARAASMGMPTSWPMTPDGKPLAIMVGMASELVPTVRFGNVQLGPAGIYLPVDVGGMDDEQILAEMRRVQRLAQTTLGMERQLLQWALDPARKVEWEQGAGS